MTWGDTNCNWAVSGGRVRSVVCLGRIAITYAITIKNNNIGDRQQGRRRSCFFRTAEAVNSDGGRHEWWESLGRVAREWTMSGRRAGAESVGRIGSVLSPGTRMASLRYEKKLATWLYS